MMVSIVGITKHQMQTSLQGTNKFLNLLQLQLIIKTNTNILHLNVKKMLLSKVFAILPEYLDLSVFLVSYTQKFWNCKYVYIYTNKYFNALINSALCIILIKSLRKLKRNYLNNFRENLESPNFVFTNQITVTYSFFSGMKMA